MSLECAVALGDQLLHFDDGVRISVMNIICDFARTNLNIPPGILQKVGDCLQDTKVGPISHLTRFLQQLFCINPS
jgi:hypothetical protein